MAKAKRSTAKQTTAANKSAGTSKRGTAATARKGSKGTTVKAARGTRSARAGAKVKGKRGRAVARRSGPARPAAPSTERYAEIQRALQARGYYNGPTDGAWNSDSVNALKRFQQDQNLNPDGKINSLSLIALGLGPKRDAAGGDVAARPASEPAVNPN